MSEGSDEIREEALRGLPRVPYALTTTKGHLTDFTKENPALPSTYLRKSNYQCINNNNLFFHSLLMLSF